MHCRTGGGADGNNEPINSLLHEPRLAALLMSPSDPFTKCTCSDTYKSKAIDEFDKTVKLREKLNIETQKVRKRDRPQERMIV